MKCKETDVRAWEQGGGGGACRETLLGNSWFLARPTFATNRQTHYMNMLILLSLHPGGLNYELDQTSNYSSKNHTVFMTTADTGNLFGKILIA
jgi:hypothetical protein